MPLTQPAKARLLNATLLVVSLTLTLAAAEAVARLLYDAPWHERLVGEQRQAEGFPYRINNRGLRGRDYPPVKGPTEKRVLFLGDSFTFGQGVFDGDKIFPSILERRLGEHLESPVTVLNGGLPASLTGHWIGLWHEQAPAFDPDVVVIVFFLRDGTSFASIPRFFGEIRETITLRNQRSRLYGSSFLYRTFRDLLDRQTISEQYTSRFHDAYFGDQEQTSEWRNAQANVLRLRDLAWQRGAVVGFVIFPMLVDLTDRHPFRDVCDLLEAFARRGSLPVHSLLPAFLGEKGPELWVSAHDQHPNEKGHAIAAESMLPFLRELLAQVPSP